MTDTAPFEPWTARRFSFDFPVSRLPVILDRLRGTAERVAAKFGDQPRAALISRPGEAWSAQEHLGHLIDLEPLHERRIGEIARGADRLSSADMENRATWDANHNAVRWQDLLKRFKAARGAFIAELGRLPNDLLGRSAIHPRLGVPMRIVDIAYFTAEHDDYHLERMESALRAANAAAAMPEAAVSRPWSDLEVDRPMDRLERRRMIGTQVMISHVTLHKGCFVPVHEHANEQFSCILSGRIRFTLADGTRDLGPGEVLHLPAHAPHGAEAIETAVVLDIFAPPSATTGIDRRAPRQGG